MTTATAGSRSMLRRLARGVPGLRPFAIGLQYAWDYARPLPAPRYHADTPQVAGRAGDFFLPPTALTLGAAAMSPESAGAVDRVLSRLTPNEAYGALRYYYEQGRTKYGDHWRFADILTALWASATLSPAESYLEIGVWRGRSTAVVAAAQPNCDIYGFDLWIPGYAGTANPGPEFVRGELALVGHRGSATLITGDSRLTLPKYLREHPDLYFDLMTIDGAKTAYAIASDLAHALPRLKVGGVVVSDDVSVFPIVRKAWDKATVHGRRFERWEFSNGGYGVAIAIRNA